MLVIWVYLADRAKNMPNGNGTVERSAIKNSVSDLQLRIAFRTCATLLCNAYSDNNLCGLETRRQGCFTG
jgi:hypothetical protein